MLSISKIKEFQWDKGNVDKSYQKHEITPNEAEESFLDVKALVLRDVKHSQKEERYALIGRTTGNKLLFVVFTLRGKKTRIISARPANRKEKRKYG